MDRDFPGGPGVKTSGSQCRGPGLDPWLGNKDPLYHTAWPPKINRMTGNIVSLGFVDPVPQQKESLACFSFAFGSREMQQPSEDVWSGSAHVGKATLGICLLHPFSSSCCPSHPSSLTVTLPWSLSPSAQVFFL